MSVGARLDRLWYPPAPAARLALLRIAVGAYALVYTAIRYANLTSVTRFSAAQFAPIGPVQLVAAPLASWLVHGIAVVCLLSGLAFVLGALYRVSGPLFALSFLWVTSYRSAWGMVFHTENLVALHLLLLSVAPAADALALDARKHDRSAVVDGRYGWAIRAMSVVTVIVYVLAGVAKLRLTSGHWLDGAILRSQVAYDNVRKIELGSMHSPLGAWIVRWEWPFRALAWATLLLELGAPAALFGRQLAFVWVLGVFSFHVGVVLLMAIGFPYQLSFVAYLSFFAIERWALSQKLARALGRDQ